MTTAALPATNLTLKDIADMKDPNGSVAKFIVPSLLKKNSVLADAVWQEGNLDTGHQVTTESALPSVYFKRLNAGTAASKGTSTKLVETCGILIGRSEVDVQVADVGGQPAAVRAAQDMQFVRAMNNKFETSFFYSNTKTDPEEIMGLTPRLNLTTSNYGGQIITYDASPSGSDQTSVWLVGWGTNKVSCITPKGSGTGLQHKDHGEQRVLDSNSLAYQAYVSEFIWKFGVAVHDARYLSRIANIDTSAIASASLSGAALVNAMVKASWKIYDLGDCKPVFYCNRTVGLYLHLQAIERVTNSTLSIENIGGHPITMVNGIPVHITDALVNTEAVVS